jgi:dihydrofolate reductase
MSINAIMACTLDFGIGNKGDLPWPKNKKDLAWFKEQTFNHVVVMGRTTWESIGSRALPGRTNIVVSTKEIIGADRVESGYMEHILARVKDKYPDQTIWIIGGEDIYRQSLQFCDKLYLTTFNHFYPYDRSMDSSILDDFPKITYDKNDDGLTFQIRERT